MIQTRDVTVTTLLAFAMQTAMSAARALKNTTKEAHTKEVLKNKLLYYRLYVDMTQKITKLINCVTNREPNVKVDDEVNKINNFIEFMNNKKVFPRYKPIDSEPNAEQFLTANSDEGTMTLACHVLSNNTPDDQITAEWRRHTEAHRKAKDKDRMFNQMNVRYANLLTSFKTPWHNYGDPETKLEASFALSTTSLDIKKSCRATTKQSRTFEGNNRQHYRFLKERQVKLNQYINTIESFANLYGIPKLEIVTLRTRGKPNEIIAHTIEDDSEADWPIIKRKLISNYGAAKK